jgi:hypothetical protein
MKKITLLTVVLAAMTLGSCKKNYTCTCTFTGGGTTSTVSTTIHDTKKKATDACNQSATAGGSGYSCAIK